MLGEGGQCCDAVFLFMRTGDIAAGDDEALRAVAELAGRVRSVQGRTLGTTAQGRAFLEATRAAWPCPALEG